MQRPAKPRTSVRFRAWPPPALLAIPLLKSLSGPDGGKGRRKGLKIPRSKDRAGSSPAPGTTLYPISLNAPLEVPAFYKVWPVTYIRALLNALLS